MVITTWVDNNFYKNSCCLLEKVEFVVMLPAQTRVLQSLRASRLVWQKKIIGAWTGQHGHNAFAQSLEVKKEDEGFFGDGIENGKGFSGCNLHTYGYIPAKVDQSELHIKACITYLK